LPAEGTVGCKALARGHDCIFLIGGSGSDCSSLIGCSGTNFSHLDLVVYSAAPRNTNLGMVEIELGVGRRRKIGLGGGVRDGGSVAGGAAARFWRSPQGERSGGRRVPDAGGAASPPQGRGAPRSAPPAATAKTRPGASRRTGVGRGSSSKTCRRRRQ